MLNLVLLEILVKVLDPFESLPGRTVARFCFWAVLGISTAVAFSVMMPSGHKGPLIEVPLTIERTIFLADAALLWILLVQAKKLGITWKSAVAEIAIGFVLYLTVQSTTRFVVSIYTDPMLRSSPARWDSLPSSLPCLAGYGRSRIATRWMRRSPQRRWRKSSSRTRKMKA